MLYRIIDQRTGQTDDIEADHVDIAVEKFCDSQQCDADGIEAQIVNADGSLSTWDTGECAARQG